MSVHHRDARRKALGGVASTFANPLIALEIGTKYIDEDPRFETGIENILKFFFCDVLSREDVGVKKEAKKRREHESKIKDQCNKLLYKEAKVSKIHVLLGLLNLQAIYGWSECNNFVSTIA